MENWQTHSSVERKRHLFHPFREIQTRLDGHQHPNESIFKIFQRIPSGVKYIKTNKRRLQKPFPMNSLSLVAVNKLHNRLSKPRQLKRARCVAGCSVKWGGSTHVLSLNSTHYKFTTVPIHARFCIIIHNYTPHTHKKVFCSSTQNAFAASHNLNTQLEVLFALHLCLHRCVYHDQR